MVNEPEAPASTFTDAPVALPLIVPLPVIDQLCVTVPPAGFTVEVYALPVDDAGTGSGPSTVQEGVVTVTIFWQEPGQPVRTAFNVSVKLPGAPAVTVTEVPVVPLVIVPFPEMVQERVTVPPAGLMVEVKLFPVDPVTTDAWPLIVQVVGAETVTTFVHIIAVPL